MVGCPLLYNRIILKATGHLLDVLKPPDRQYLLLAVFFYKGCGMKKIIFGFIGMLFVFSSYAVDLTLEYYDDTFYSEIDPGYASAGQLTGVSDTYYSFKPFEGILKIEEQHWLGDGRGGEYEDSNSPHTIYYYDVSFDWLKSYFADYDFLIDRPFDNLKNQFDNWVLNNVSEIADLSVFNISKNIVKQHNIDVYNSVFGNAKFDEKKFSVWGTTLFNSMTKSGKYDYSTNGLSVVLGADLQLSDTVLVGMGYSYSNTDVDISPSDILFDNSSLFIYSKWKPSKFYLNAIVSYDFADYEYVDSDFNNGDVSGLFASVMAGYNMDSGISPEIGIRYTNLEINHNSEYLKKSESDFSSVIAGVKYERALGKFVLGGHVMVEYDIIQPDGDIDIDVLGYKYNLTIEDTERPLGVEFGVWAEYNINGINLRLNYDLRLHTDMVNHTGGLSLLYCF